MEGHGSPDTIPLTRSPQHDHLNAIASAGAFWRFQNLEKQELREARTWRNQNGGVADRRFEEDHML